MKTYFLIFPDEPTALSVLLPLYGAVDGQGVQRLPAAWHGGAVDIIGILCTPGEYAADTSVIVAPKELPGWRVILNLRSPDGLPDTLTPYLAQSPEAMPCRIFYGQ